MKNFVVVLTGSSTRCAWLGEISVTRYARARKSNGGEKNEIIKRIWGGAEEDHLVCVPNVESTTQPYIRVFIIEVDSENMLGGS